MVAVVGRVEERIDRRFDMRIDAARPGALARLQGARADCGVRHGVAGRHHEKKRRAHETLAAHALGAQP